MFIKTLTLRNFRNFEFVAQLEFPPESLLVAAAPNATGKTNFLESLVVLLRGKSWRADLAECVSWGKEGLAVAGDIKRSNGEESRLAVRYMRADRKLRIEENNTPVSPVTFYASYPLVLFLPEDTFLFSRGPATRRNFLNHILACSAPHLFSLVQYHRVLRQRNAALKRVGTIQAVQPWTELLQEHGVSVWKERRMLVDFIQSHLPGLYAELMGEVLPLAVEFKPGLPGEFKEELTIEGYGRALQEAWPDEKKYQYTLAGPHRDDMEILIEGRSIQSVLSRGQMRGVVIALKIVAYRFMKQLTKEEPLVLLDDVLSELDEGRQRTLLEHLPTAQTLLTCTVLPAVLQERADVQFLDIRTLLAAPAPTTVPAAERVPSS
jgi:DNA replication and repair protein RecF